MEENEKRGSGPAGGSAKGRRTGRDLGAEFENLKRDLARLRDDVLGVADAFTETARRAAQEQAERLREAAQSARAEGGRKAEDVGRDGEEGMRRMREQIEERPIASILLALGIGLLLGRLFSR